MFYVPTVALKIIINYFRPVIKIQLMPTNWNMMNSTPSMFVRVPMFPFTGDRKKKIAHFARQNTKKTSKTKFAKSVKWG